MTIFITIEKNKGVILCRKIKYLKNIVFILYKNDIYFILFIRISLLYKIL